VQQGRRDHRRQCRHRARRGAREHAPIKRFGSPEELANFFVSLCSEKASYSVGSTYDVDGGMLKSL
jgi:3-oxoacyl-[acyl-carrier protein] reductase